jgi:(hydroxyamino)benzene mutase
VTSQTPDWAQRQGHRLLQIGVLLFLGALFVGLFVPQFAVPRLGLSVHLLGLLQGIFLMVLGLLWPRLLVSPTAGRVGVFLVVYGCVAALTANFLAAFRGAGHGMLPIAAGAAHGTSIEETLISVALRSAAASLIVANILVLWGLRRFSGPEPRT